MDLAKRMAAQADKAIMSALCGTSTVSAAPSEPLTLDSIRKMMLKMPPKETWLSTRLFPDSNAMVVEGTGERFTVAGPGFWARLTDHFRKNPEPPSISPNPLLTFNMTPVEIDPWEGDSEETAKWRAAHWDRLIKAVEIAMTPLPEWLRSPPKFGKHG